MKNTGRWIALLLLTACVQAFGGSTRAISSGTLISVELLHMKSADSYRTTKITDGSIEVHASFIIVTDNDGISFVSPHDSYMNLSYRDR